VTALLTLAERHAGDPVLARTLMQPTSVISFGLKCAGWAAPLVRSQQRLSRCSHAALNLQLGGAVGTLAQLKGKGAQVMALMAVDLNLKAPAFAWHTQRDEWVALGCELGLLVGSLGKIAKDMSLMAQFEVGELAEPFEPVKKDSNGLPPDRHQLACMVTLAAAQRTPHRVAALLSSMPQEHERGLGHGQAELAEWPALLTSAHGAARAMAQALPGLQVDAPRMRANLDAVRTTVSAKVADEWFNPALAQEAAALTRLQIAALRTQTKPSND
jgi:3-carboxy-cis,cis-muconate cycloisomerase